MDRRFAMIAAMSGSRSGGSTTQTFFAQSQDGYTSSFSGDADVGPNGIYADARAGTGTATITANNPLLEGDVGQQLLNNGFDFFQCNESLFSWDTSIIPVGATVTSAILKITPASDFSVTDFIMEARIHDWGASVTVGDWVAGAALGGKLLVAHYDTANGFTPNVEVTFIDDAFAANVVKGGITRILINSSRHRLGNQPTGNELVSIWNAEQTGTSQDPKLVVTWHA